jgi:hypothetical protein
VAILERYYSTDNTNDDDIDPGYDVSESEDDILQIHDAGVSEDQEIDVNKEIYAAVDHSNFTDETDVTSFAGLSLRGDPDGSSKEFVDIYERPDTCFQSRSGESCEFYRSYFLPCRHILLCTHTRSHRVHRWSDLLDFDYFPSIFGEYSGLEVYETPEKLL